MIYSEMERARVRNNAVLSKDGARLAIIRASKLNYLSKANMHPVNTERTTLILSFYLGSGTDHKGRFLDHILQKSDRWLEETHDYIQWLFPLNAPSQFNPSAPFLTAQVCKIFSDSAGVQYPVVQRNFMNVIRRMLAFYGYSVNLLNPTQVEGAADWKKQSKHWLTPSNHNHLRISRMLRSMCLLGRTPLAQSWHSSLGSVGIVHHDIVSNTTLKYWGEAVLIENSQDAKVANDNGDIRSQMKSSI